MFAIYHNITKFSIHKEQQCKCSLFKFAYADHIQGDWHICFDIYCCINVFQNYWSILKTRDFCSRLYEILTHIFSAWSAYLTISLTLSWHITVVLGPQQVSGESLNKYLWPMGDTQIFLSVYGNIRGAYIGCLIRNVLTYYFTSL